MTAIALEIRSDRGVFDELAEWWNGCPGPRTSPFLRSDWFSLWADSFLTKGQTLEVAIWRTDERPLAILPLSREGIRRASLSNAHGDVFDVIMEEENAGEHVESWLTRRPATRLYRLDGASPLFSGLSSAGLHVTGRSESPYLDLSGGIDGVRTAMGDNLNKNIDRLERRLSKLGQTTYLDNADGVIPGAVETCMELEASGWKGETGTAMLSQPESGRFYRGLIELARSRGWLRLATLTIGDQIIACQFCLDYNGSRFLLKPAYDESLKKHSPGKVLQWMVIREAVDRGLDTYEFGGDAEDWKMHWTQTTRPRVSAIQFASNGPTRLVGQSMKLLYERTR